MALALNSSGITDRRDKIAFHLVRPRLSVLCCLSSSIKNRTIICETVSEFSGGEELI